ncbi:MAG: amidohydrolase [bacterium]|jgi:omega-amidase
MQRLIVTTIQTDLKWEDKQANLKMIEDKIRSISEKTNIVVLPEMFSTGFSMRPETLAETMDGPTVVWMKNISKEKNIILAGSVIVQEEEQYFNRLLWALPNGEIGVYDKRHCFSLAGEDQHYTPGNKRSIASVGGWKINLQICYDLRFPVWSRQQIQQDPEKEITPEYDVLIYVANWPEKRSNAWKTLLQARAIENQCYVIGVNRVGHDGNDLYHSGNSMVVDPLGEVMYEKAHDEDVHTITLERSRLDEVRKNLPFWLDGDNFLIV